MIQYFSAQELFTGKHWFSEVVIEVVDGKIGKIHKEGYEAKNAYPLIVPALIDLQIYGAEEKLLSIYPEVDTIEKIYTYCLQGGAAYFMPTIASESNEVILQSIEAVKAYMLKGGKGCLGLHIEGPWINVLKKGAHNENIIHAPSVEEVEKIIEAGRGYIGMVTVAPEICDIKIIRLLQENGIVVSAGHTNASFEEAMHFFDGDIKVATHLFNAMSPFSHRAPGVVGALFTHKTAMCSLVADGHHVDFSAIKIAKQLMGERLFCITDAVTTTTKGQYQHQLVGTKYENAGTLSGSSLTQLKSVNNLVNEVGLDLGEAIKMCSTYPAKVMNREGINGTIETGAPANLLFLSTDRQLLKMVTT
jgi:N-acetylglucosamine-6-phosphate deacetylase